MLLRKIISDYLNVCGPVPSRHNPPTLQTDGRTDSQTVVLANPVSALPDKNSILVDGVIPSGVTMGWLLRLVTGAPLVMGPPTVREF